MRKGLTLPQVIEIKGASIMADLLNVDPQTVYHWKNFRSAPTPATAARIIELSGGLVTWESIYSPFVAAQAKDQLSFDFGVTQ